MIRTFNKSFKNITNLKTLFLDRDGVINVKIDNDYVKNVDEFVFKKKVFDALKILNTFYDIIIIVTNQRGIGRGLMTNENLNTIHDYMISEFKKKKLL